LIARIVNAHGVFAGFARENAAKAANTCAAEMCDLVLVLLHTAYTSLQFVDVSLVYCN